MVLIFFFILSSLSLPDGHSGGCGVNDETLQWMDSVQNGAVEDDAEVPREKKPKRTNKQQKQGIDKNSIYEEDLKYPHLKYSKEANFKDGFQNNENTDDDWHQESHERAKRAARPKEDNKNTCSLYIQTDPLIWRHIREGIADVSGYYFMISMLFFFIIFYVFDINNKTVFPATTARSWSKIGNRRENKGGDSFADCPPCNSR